MTKHHKWNGVVILDEKIHNNAIQEISSDTSKISKAQWRPNLKT